MPASKADRPMLTDARYLASKRTVDDRALNQDVVRRLRSEVAGRPLRVLEVGAGLGTMVARLVDWQVLRQADYGMLEVDPQLLADARGWLSAWASSAGLEAEEEPGTLRLHGGRGVDVRVRFLQAELGDFLDGPEPEERADLLLANAFLDLVEVPATLPKLLGLAEPGGLFWFTINYDGETLFQPEHPLDRELMEVYHRTMDERVRYGRPAGESRTGRHLFGHLRQAGATLLAAGSSDWVVFGSGGVYEGEEAGFLHHILDTVDRALRVRPEVDREALDGWVALRRARSRPGTSCTWPTSLTSWAGFLAARAPGQAARVGGRVPPARAGRRPGRGSTRGPANLALPDVAHPRPGPRCGPWRPGRRSGSPWAGCPDVAARAPTRRPRPARFILWQHRGKPPFIRRGAATAPGRRPGAACRPAPGAS